MIPKKYNSSCTLYFSYGIMQSLDKKCIFMSIPSCYPSKKPKAVFFDWDNTLINTCPIAFHGVNAVMQHFGKKQFSWEEYMQLASLSDRSFFQTCFQDEEIPRAAALLQKVMSEPNSSHIFSGVQSLLTLLQKEKIPSGVVSNRNGDMLREEAKSLELSSYFQCLVGSCDTSKDKPDPLPLLYALEKVHLTPGHDIWFVGDSLADVLCAYQAGCVPVLIGAREKVPCPVISVRDCAHIEEILKSFLHSGA